MKIKILLAAVFVALFITGCKNVPDESLQPTTDMVEMESSMMDEVFDTETTTQSSTDKSTTVAQTQATTSTGGKTTNDKVDDFTKVQYEKQTKGSISAALAEEIALSHAGVSKSEAQRLRSELNTDDGKYEYEVEFYANGYEYDYEIDASTGRLNDFDKDKD